MLFVSLRRALCAHELREFSATPPDGCEVAVGKNLLVSPRATAVTPRRAVASSHRGAHTSCVCDDDDDDPNSASSARVGARAPQRTSLVRGGSRWRALCRGKDVRFECAKTAATGSVWGVSE